MKSYDVRVLGKWSIQWTVRVTASSEHEAAVRAMGLDASNTCLSVTEV